MEILKYTRKRFKNNIILSTNGVLLDKFDLYELVNCVDYISLSLDGFDEESCSKVRGKGVFDKVIANTQNLQSTGFTKIGFSMIINKYTENYIEKFYKLCENNKVGSITRSFSPQGRGFENKDNLMPSLMNNVMVENEKMYCNLCFPGEKEIFINPIGDIYPCGALMEKTLFKMGNIMEKTLVEIIEDKSYINDVIEKYRPWKKEECKDCNVNLFCHNCIAHISSIMQDEKIFTKYCALQKKII